MHMCRSVPSDSAGEGTSPDIDALAKLLSQQAAKLRASMSDDDVAEMIQEEERVVYQQLAPTALPKAMVDLEGVLLREVGEGGFTSDDFEIVTRLGHISVQQGSGAGAFAAPQTAVIAYAARYIARIAYSLPVPTMIKEYLPVAKAVAYNELLLLKHLCGLPDDKYQAAVMRPPRTGPGGEPPVVPLLGYFTSAPSEDAVIEVSGGGQQAEEDSLWLVYKWEGLKPLTMLMEAGPPEVRAGLFKKREVAEREAWARRRATLRAVAARLLAAVDYCHSADVAHGSLSPGSVFVSASGDVDPRDLILKLDGFGFGKWYSAGLTAGGALGGPGTAGGRGSGPGPSLEDQVAGIPGPGPQLLTDSALEEGKKADLQSVALLLGELWAAGLSEGADGRLPRPALRRLMFDVFHNDTPGLREYCLQDGNGSFARLVEFLDEQDGGGWDLLGALLAGTASALQLSQHRFVRDL